MKPIKTTDAMYKKFVAKYGEPPVLKEESSAPVKDVDPENSKLENIFTIVSLIKLPRLSDCECIKAKGMYVGFQGYPIVFTGKQYIRQPNGQLIKASNSFRKAFSVETEIVPASVVAKQLGNQNKSFVHLAVYDPKGDYRTPEVKPVTEEDIADDITEGDLDLKTQLAQSFTAAFR